MTYNFPAIRGLQAGKEYFICMVELGLLTKIFMVDDEETPPEYRAQRRLNEIRIPEIRDYILLNRNTYVFSALAASIDGAMTFEPSQKHSQLGELHVDMNATFMINDGQHRKAAIVQAIKSDQTLSNETIAVVLYKDQGLQRSQQMFTDLNKHAVTTSKSLNTLYETKDPIALMTKTTIDKISFLRKYTDKEKDNLGKYSSKIFTLNIFYNANKTIIRNSENPVEDEAFLLRFWESVVANIREWNEMDSGELSKKDLREQYIITQGVTILALGRLGRYLYCNRTIPLNVLTKLRSIDWTRNNTEAWAGKAVKDSGRINRNDQGVFSTYLQIKRFLEIPVEPEELNRDGGR